MRLELGVGEGEGEGGEEEEEEGRRDGARGENRGREHGASGDYSCGGYASSSVPGLYSDVGGAHEDPTRKRDATLHRASDEPVFAAAMGYRLLVFEVYGGRRSEESLGGFSGAEENSGSDWGVPLP